MKTNLSRYPGLFTNSSERLDAKAQRRNGAKWGYTLILLVLLIGQSLAAQTITGSIVGTVKDASGLPVAGAAVTLVQGSTGAERQTKTDDRGDFFFGSLQPGEYKISVGQAGFRRTEKQSIMLSASERLSVGDLVLEVGGGAETVTVTTAQGATVQTASAERSGSITSGQVENILIRGRNATSLLQLLPGVVDLNETEQIGRNWEVYVQGNRRNTRASPVLSAALPWVSPSPQ